MQRTHLHDLADEVVKKTSFKLGKEIYRADYYSKDRLRNIIFEGQFDNKPAVLKLYDDPRLSDEPISQITFNKINRSEKLRALEVFAHEIISPQEGWLIMEKLPEQSKTFTSPLTDRKTFIELYYEYRTNFPTTPTRTLVLAENLPADEYNILRIGRWFEIANNKDTALRLANQQGLYQPQELLSRYIKSLEIIKKEHANRPMIWCHGHFKPQELFNSPDNKIYYLTDFAHTKMYPEGHEFAFIIWADWLMSSDYSLPYTEWKKGIDRWINEFKPIAERLKINNYAQLMVANMLERTLGNILADVSGHDEWPIEQKTQRIQMLYLLLDDLIDTYGKYS